MPRPKGSKNKPKVLVIEENAVVVDSQPTRRQVQKAKENVTKLYLDSQSPYKVVMIPTGKLSYDSMNMREGIGDTPDNEFKEDIQNHGITNPLLVRPLHNKANIRNEANTEYGIVCGSRRYNKGIDTGLKEFPCIVRDMDDITALSRSLSENVYQKPIETFVYQSVFNKLYCMIARKNPTLSKNAVIEIMHRQTGKAESTIKGYLAIAEKATEETKDAMKKGKLRDSRTAQDVARLPKDKQKEAVQQIEGKPRAEAHAIIKQVKNETKATTEKPQEKTANPQERITLSFDKPIFKLLEKLTKAKFAGISGYDFQGIEDTIRKMVFQGLKKCFTKELEDACRTCLKPCWNIPSETPIAHKSGKLTKSKKRKT